MNKTEIRRNALVMLLADHLLAHGMRDTGLRTLAKAVGTSDRMLLHYFRDKEELMTAVLGVIAGNLIRILEQTDSGKLPVEKLVPRLFAAIGGPLFAPYLRIWIELVNLALREEGPYRSIATKICDTFLQWIRDALEVPDEKDRESLATQVLALIDGFLLLEVLGYRERIVAALQDPEKIILP